MLCNVYFFAVIPLLWLIKFITKKAKMFSHFANSGIAAITMFKSNVYITFLA